MVIKLYISELETLLATHFLASTDTMFMKVAFPWIDVNANAEHSNLESFPLHYAPEMKTVFLDGIQFQISSEPNILKYTKVQNTLCS